MTDLREKLIEHLRAEFGDAYDCTRVWEAWSVGTMGEDDFEPVTDRLDGIADGILALLSPVAPAGDREAVARGWYIASDPEVEPVAKAIWGAQDGDKTAWEHLFDAEQREYRAMAIAALNATPPAPPAEERAVVDAAMAFAKLAAEFDDDLSVCAEQIDTLWHACAALSSARTGSEGVS